MTSPAEIALPLLDHLRDGKNWLNDGRCCGQVDSSGTCAAPACIFGEALKYFFEAADEIDRQATMRHQAEAALTAEYRRGLEEAAQIAESAYRCWTCGTVFLERDGHDCEGPDWDRLDRVQIATAIRAKGGGDKT